MHKQRTNGNGSRRVSGNGKLKGSGRAPHNGSLILFDQVSKHYKTSAGEFTALEDVDLTIDRGEFV
jgi:hypothetical protein